MQEYEQSPRKLMQTGTQTSPESVSQTSIRSHFSIGSCTGSRSCRGEERVSPKAGRKDRERDRVSGSLGGAGKVRAKRAISPASMQQLPSSRLPLPLPPAQPVKQAISPSVAESLRAVFAAFLWHEGEKVLNGERRALIKKLMYC